MACMAQSAMEAMQLQVYVQAQLADSIGWDDGSPSQLPPKALPLAGRLPTMHAARISSAMADMFSSGG